jgi:hypothetical protein
MNISWPKTRLGIAAGVAAGSVGVALVTGFGVGPALLSTAAARGADDPATHDAGDDNGVDATVPTTTPTTTAGATTWVIDAAGAGTVTVSVSGDQLRLVSAVPAAGWTVEVEQSAGPEVEVDFRRGAQRVQVNVEIEDGAVRERVRASDDAAGTEVRIENGVVVEARGPEVGDDVDNSGPGSGDDAVDNSGPGNADEPAGDDQRTDDPADHDAGGDRVDSSGPGGGADDAVTHDAGDDHGGDG